MIRFAPLALVVLALPGYATAQGPFESLLADVPPTANTLVLIDVKAAYSSPVAKSEKWSSEYFEKYKSGIGFVPPDAEAVVIASEVNLSSMTREYQVGLVKVSRLPTIRGLAERDAGTVSEIVSTSVVNSPRDVYYTTLGGSTVAAVYPANRQATARWLRYATTSKATQLSPYLGKAVADRKDAAVTIAVDLTDSLDPALLNTAFQFSPAVVKQGGVNVGALARFVATTRGLTFSAAIDDKITGTVRIDFGADPAPFKKTLHDLFLELIADQGVHFPGIETWEATYDGGSMSLSGPLGTADLRRTLSLFAFPGATSLDSPTTKPGEVSAGATSRYWAAVMSVLDDTRKLRERLKNARDYSKLATWFDKSAVQIEQLNQLGVDPLAIEVGHESAKRFRAIAGSLRGVPIDVDALSQKSYYYVHTSAWPVWGGWWNWRGLAFSQNVQTNVPKVRGEMARVIADDQKKRLDAWGQIDQIVSENRRKLSEKYMDKF